jgi:hypothetical protein
MTEPRSRDIFPGLEKASSKEVLGGEVKSATDSILKSPKKNFVVFVLGGLTHSEYLTLKKIEKRYNKNILVVTTNILNQKYLKKFIDDI